MQSEAAAKTEAVAGGVYSPRSSGFKTWDQGERHLDREAEAGNEQHRVARSATAISAVADWSTGRLVPGL